MSEQPAASAPRQEPQAHLTPGEVRAFAAQFEAQRTNLGRAKLLRELAERIRAAE